MKRSAILAVGALFLLIGLVEALTGSKKAAPVSASFQPWAASFVSPSTGFVLGGVGCRFDRRVTAEPCSAVIGATDDGGTTWIRVASPAAPLASVVNPDNGAAANSITFADSRDGWLYGPSLWATHDGGRHWTRVPLTTPIEHVVAAGGWAYATLEDPTNAVPVLRSPVGRDDWRPVPGLPRADHQGNETTVATSGAAAYVGLELRYPGPSAIWRTAGGTNWERLPNPCPHAVPLEVLGSGTPRNVFAFCNGAPQLAISTDAGAHVAIVDAPHGDFIPGPFAVPSGQAAIAVMAAPDHAVSVTLPRRQVPAASFVYRTTDGGRSWRSTRYADHGAGFGDLQFVSPTVGFVVHGYPGATTDELLRTTDAGATFTPVSF